MVELALDSPLDAEQQELLTTAHESGWTLLRLLNELLDFEKIETGAMALAISPFALAKTIESAAELFDARAKQKGLALHTRIDAALPAFVSGDTDRLRQALANLVGNAVKFTEQGTIEVRAQRFEMPRSGRVVV